MPLPSIIGLAARRPSGPEMEPEGDEPEPVEEVDAEREAVRTAAEDLISAVKMGDVDAAEAALRAAFMAMKS